MKALPWTAIVLALVVFGFGGCPPATQGPTQDNGADPGTNQTPAGGDANSPATTGASEEFQTIYNEYYSRIGGISAGPGVTGDGTTGDDDPNEIADPNIPTPDPNEPPPAESWTAAVDRVGLQIVGLSAALSACSELADPRLDRTALIGGSYGTCPEINFASSDQFTLVPVDYSDGGCSSSFTAGRTFSGNLAAIIANLALSIKAQYVSSTSGMSFTLAGHTVTGSIEGGVSFSTNHFGLNADCAIAITGVGTSNGHIVGDFTDDGPYTLSSSSGPVFLTDTAGTYQVDLALLVVDVLGNGNFVPESGTATFEITNASPPPATQTVVVTFTSQSPTTGTVQVSIAGGAATPHQIVGLTAGP